MTALDCILDGVEAELELERELGVRVVECDRSLLSPAAAAEQLLRTPVAPLEAAPPPVFARPSPPSPPPSAAGPQPAAQVRGADAFDFAFLHDRPLSADAQEMMRKIVVALGRTPETAPVVCDGAMPPASVYVVLGGNALKKWFPGVNAAPGQWISAAAAPNVLVTYSPAFILRFGAGNPAVKKLKMEMWQSLKSIRGRLGLAVPA